MHDNQKHKTQLITHAETQQNKLQPIQQHTAMEEASNAPTAESKKRAHQSPDDIVVSHESNHEYHKQLVAQVLPRYYKETERTHEESKVPALLHTPSDTNHSSNFLFQATNCDELSNHSHAKGSQSMMIARTLSDERDTFKSITDHDVLFGRRSSQRNNPGNMRLRELCSQLYPEYKDGNRAQKTSLTWQIVRTIQSEGGRFLKSENNNQNSWREVSDEMAREKVAFTIRDLNLSNADG